MSLTPCIITHIPTKKVVSVEEALDLVWNDPKLRGVALDLIAGTEKKAEAPKAEEDPIEAYFKSLLDQTKNTTGLNAALYRGMVQAILSTYQAGKNVAKAIQAGIDYLIQQGVSQEEAEAEAEKIRVALPKEAVPPPPVNEKPEPTQTGGESKERKFITSIKEATDISDAVKEALGGERTRYEVLPNEISVKEANAILNAIGETEARVLVLNSNERIPGAFRTALAQVLMKSYNQKGEFANAVSIAEGISEMATDWGQAVQALSLFQYLTPEGQLLAAQRAIDAQVEKKFKEHKTKMDDLKKTLKKANKEAVDEALDKVAGRIETVGKPAVPKRPLSYGEKNKIFTDNAYKKAKAGLKNFAFSGIPPELVTIAGYHIEAGARSFADFSKEMVKDFGRKVKPYLKGAYKAAQAKLKGDGYSTDKEIADYLASDLEKDVKDILKESGVKIQELIRQHYTESEKVKQTLTEKLIDRLGLSPEDAATVAKAVETEFNKIATEKKEKAIAAVYNRLKRKSPQIKSLQQKLIELSNLGAFDEAQFKEAYAEAMGFPKLTPENAAEIKRLAELAQNAKEGLPKFRATEDLLKYQATIKGSNWYEIPMAIWMSSILSGTTTQVKNLVANSYNTLALLTNIAAQNPKNIPFILKGLSIGIKKGLLEGQDVLRTGYSPIRDKAQIPDILERTEFKGLLKPYNLYKYVRRAMVASDVITFEGLKEMRAYQMALAQAKQDFPDADAQQKALDLLNSTSDAIAIAQDKANDEFNEVKANIEANTELSEEEKEKQIRQADLDRKRRTFEFIEELRPDQLVSEAHDFAERGTYNNKPDGILGVLAQGMNQLAYRAPLLRLVVPFTNVITNVANETINYSPVGFWRAEKGGSISGNRKEFTEQQKTDLQYKAAMGTLAMVIAYTLASVKGDDEDDEPLIEITADGYGDFKKNKDLQQSGWNEYSIRIGDNWFSYKLTPMVAILSIVGALKDYEKYRKGKLDDNAFTKIDTAIGQAISTITELTFLPSVDKFISALVDRKGEGRVQGLTDWAAKTGSAAVPVIGSNFYQQLVLLTQQKLGIPDKEYRETYLGKSLRTIPIARSMYENALNGLGEEITPDQSGFVIELKHEKETQKLWDLLAKRKASTGAPDRKGASWVDENGRQCPMSDKQFYTYAKARGEYIRNMMEVNYGSISKMDDADFNDWISKVRSDANNYAQAEIGSSGKEITTTSQQARALLHPNEQAQSRAKELATAALQTGDATAAKEAFEKIVAAYPTPLEKYKAVKEVVKDATDEKDLKNRLKMTDKDLVRFFKVMEGRKVMARGKEGEMVDRMHQIADNPEMHQHYEAALAAEYATAKRILEFANQIEVKKPTSGGVMTFEKPSWMKRYEKIVINN